MEKKITYVDPYGGGGGGTVSEPETRETLADYFYKRLRYYAKRNKVTWHIWNVEMGIQDSPNIPDITWISPNRLDAEIIYKARSIIFDTLRNSGLGPFYEYLWDIAEPVIGTGSSVINDDMCSLQIPEAILPANGTEKQVICEYIYNHALAHGYRDNALHKGIYLCPYPPLETPDGLLGVWPEVAAAVSLPEFEKYSRENFLAIVQYRVMRALLKIYSQTQGHVTIPGVGSKCIWAGWTTAADQINAARNDPHWCDSHKKFIEMVSNQLTYCNICGHYITAKFGWFDDLHVGAEPNFEYLRAGGGFTAKCPYCETFEEEVPATEEDPATIIQYATHYCPTCHRFQRSWAPYQSENQSKVVANLDGVDVYLSQADLLNNIIGSIIPPAVLTAMGVGAWQVYQAQHVSALTQLIQSSTLWQDEMLGPETLPSMDIAGAGLYYQQFAKDFQMRTVTDEELLYQFWQKIALRSTNEFIYKPVQDYPPYLSCPAGGTCKTPIPEEYAQPSSSNWTLKKTGAVILAILAVIAIIVLLTKKGIILHHSYEGGLPTITTQKGGYGVPRCIKCEFDLMKQWAEQGRITTVINPLVLMQYGTDISKAAYIPDWFIDSSSQPMPGDPDYMV